MENEEKEKKEKVEKEKPKEGKLKYLTPIILSDEEIKNDVFFQHLDNALKKEGINNIAVSGHYGSGKSTKILTYCEKFIKNTPKEVKDAKLGVSGKHKIISLAKFSNEKEDDKKEDSKLELEYCLLEQLFYTVDKETVSKSKFRPSVSISKVKVAILSLIFTICLMTISHLFHNDKELNTILIDGNNIFKQNSIKLSGILGVGIILFFMICFVLYLLIKLLTEKKFKSISTPFFNIQSQDNKDLQYSLFDYYLEDVILYFNQTKIKYLFIEDIDRFDDLNIYTKLRELNKIINESRKPKDKKVKFIYSLRDDIFKDINNHLRTKFFDAIISIVPIVSCFNSADKMHEYFLNCDFGPEKKVINDLIFYISDLRTINSIYNDYLIYYQSIIGKEGATGENLDIFKNKLFCMMIYKNVFYNDFFKATNQTGFLAWVKKFKETMFNHNNKNKNNSDIDFNKMTYKQIIDEYNGDFKKKITVAYNDYLKFEKKNNAKKDDYINYETRHIDLIFSMIINEYLDENYLEYISKLPSGFTVNDMKFYSNIISDGEPLYDIKISNYRSVMKRISADKYDRKAIINSSFLLSVLKDYEEDYPIVYKPFCKNDLDLNDERNLNVFNNIVKSSYFYRVINNFDASVYKRINKDKIWIAIINRRLLDYKKESINFESWKDFFSKEEIIQKISTPNIINQIILSTNEIFDDSKKLQNIIKKIPNIESLGKIRKMSSTINKKPTPNSEFAFFGEIVLSETDWKFILSIIYIEKLDTIKSKDLRNRIIKKNSYRKSSENMDFILDKNKADLNKLCEVYEHKENDVIILTIESNFKEFLLYTSKNSNNVKDENILKILERDFGEDSQDLKMEIIKNIENLKLKLEDIRHLSEYEKIKIKVIEDNKVHFTLSNFQNLDQMYEELINYLVKDEETTFSKLKEIFKNSEDEEKKAKYSITLYYELMKRLKHDNHKNYIEINELFKKYIINNIENYFDVNDDVKYGFDIKGDIKFDSDIINLLREGLLLINKKIFLILITPTVLYPYKRPFCEDIILLYANELINKNIMDYITSDYMLNNFRKLNISILKKPDIEKVRYAKVAYFEFLFLDEKYAYEYIKHYHFFVKNIKTDLFAIKLLNIDYNYKKNIHDSFVSYKNHSFKYYLQVVDEISENLHEASNEEYSDLLENITDGDCINYLNSTGMYAEIENDIKTMERLNKISLLNLGDIKDDEIRKIVQKIIIKSRH